MIQNHMLQLLALTAMEPPVLFDERQVRDEKHKVLQAIRPIRPEDVQSVTVRGQYAQGTTAGKTVPAYKKEKGVAPDSTRETYVALKFTVDDWRWADVPFYVRSGKRLPKRITEIAVQFKKTPHHMFSGLANDRLSCNSIVIRIQPDEGISLRFNSKIPGSKMRMRPVTMDFRYGAAFGGRLVEAYTTASPGLHAGRSHTLLSRRQPGNGLVTGDTDPGRLEVQRTLPGVSLSGGDLGSYRGRCNASG